MWPRRTGGPQRKKGKTSNMDTDKLYAQKIASEYAPKDTSKVVALRKLDAAAKRPALIFGYTFGSVAALLLGLGMCLTMGVIGGGSTGMFVLGIVIGVIALVCMTVNPMIYNKMLATGKAKYAADIMALAAQIGDEK